MERLAIIGTGIAGLGCAYFLHPHYDITLFEKNDYIGGHVNTVEVTRPNGVIPVDTGFMVFNHITYPNLCKLFDRLEAKTLATDMSFSVQHREQDLEWNGAGYNRLFGQRKNLLRPRFWRMLFQLNRFNQDAIEAIENASYGEMTIQDYVDARGYGDDMLNLYLLPMSSSIWSNRPEKIRHFPIRTLLMFFRNHGFLGMDTHYQWYTVVGGAKTYVQKMIAPFAHAIRSDSPVLQVTQAADQVILTLKNGETHRFDKVVLATHADEALALLTNPDALQQRLLSPFRYEHNLAQLHTDASVMPQTKRCWAAWNYRIDMQGGGDKRCSTHYWMNRLQHISGKTQYIVSINGDHLVDPESVLQTIDYEHPIYTLEAIRAQEELDQLNTPQTGRRVFFSGSYFKYGFHEDAFSSAVKLCEQLTGGPVW